jgi:hypothetical protein
MATAVLEVKPATTVKGAEVPVHVVCPSRAVPVNVIEYPGPATMPPIVALTLDEFAALIDPE